MYFLVNALWAKKLEKWAPEFKALIYKDVDKKDAKNDSDSNSPSIFTSNSDANQKDVTLDPKKDPLNILIQEFGKSWKKSPLERIHEILYPFQMLTRGIEDIKDDVLRLVNDLQPDLILFDQLSMVSFLLKPWPWGQIMTMNPLFIQHDKLPPPMSGYGTDPKEYGQKWKEFREVAAECLAPFLEEQNERLRKVEFTELQPGHFIIPSPYLNIYIYPSDIDYFGHDPAIQLPGKWVRMDSSFLPARSIENSSNEHVSPSIEFERKLKHSTEVFETESDRVKALQSKIPGITNEWANLPGKIIYFSLGSMASAYLELTTRLVDLIAEIPHRFIVSKGPLGDEFELPPNCVGGNFIDQNLVLRCVDVMITHGGNNTLSECFHFGVPVIVLPLFSDQPDNARRVMETELGGSLNAFQCTATELRNEIERLTNDQKLVQRVRNIGKRMRQDNGMDRAVQEINQYLSKKQNHLTSELVLIKKEQTLAHCKTCTCHQ